MTTSVVGYEEQYYPVETYTSIPMHDEYNKIPKFCSRCGRELKAMNKSDTYDIYTGEPIEANYLVCKTLNSTHDIWHEEEYGAWVKY